MIISNWERFTSHQMARIRLVEGMYVVEIQASDGHWAAHEAFESRDSAYRCMKSLGFWQC